tara:strand:- start:562 stop:1359 length:798 start_codon:yes stop_codon:yes gene_type:complete
MPVAEGWKFRDVNEGTLSLLINRELWFSNPIFFNDPFDCQIDIDGSFESVEEEIENHWPDDLAAFKEGVKLHHSEHAYGYFCLCQDWKQSLMWSHYANEHKGIALGFSFSSGSQFGITQLERNEIIYKTDAFKNAIKNLSGSFNMMKAYPTNHPHLMDGEAQDFQHTFRQNWMSFYEVIRYMKSECWEYEKELRYELELETKDQAGVSRKFSPDDLKHIVFGIRCSQRKIDTIRTLLDNSDWAHLKYWKASPDPVNLVVTAQELT